MSILRARAPRNGGRECGEMAFNEQVGAKKQGKTISKTAVKTERTTGGVRDKKTPVGESVYELLCCDVEKEVGKHSKRFAGLMRKEALSGNVSFAKMMLEIVKPKHGGKGAGQSRRVFSLAQTLAKQPQWKGPIPGEEKSDYDGTPEPVETTAVK